MKNFGRKGFRKPAGSRMHRWLLAVCWVAGLLLTACGSRHSYECALPKDAALVVRTDLAAMAAKSGLNDKAGKNAMRRLREALKSGMEGSSELIDRMMDNPDESGLDLKSAVYLFAEPQGDRFGLLVKVLQRGKVDDLLQTLAKQQLCEEVRESDGCRWTALGKVLVAYNRSAFVAMVDPATADAREMQHAVAMLLRQDEQSGFAASPHYRQLQQEQGDIVVYASMNLLPQQWLAPLTMSLSAELKQEEVNSLSVIHFESGKAVMDIRSLTTDPVMLSFREKLHRVVAPVEGKYLDLFPANTLCWMTGRIDGEAFYRWLMENPVVARELDSSMLPIDFESIFSSVKGDVALALTDLTGQHFIAYADVTDSGFLRTFEDLKPLLALTGGQMKLLDDGDDAYEFRTSGGWTGRGSLWFGVRNSRLYITNDRNLVDARVLGLSLRDNPWGSRVAGKYFYLALNANVVSHTFSRQLKGNDVLAQFLAILAGLDYLTVESEDGVNAHVELVMKDRKRNFLQNIWQ